MKSTHHMFRVASLAVGLALLMVTGTAAMIGTFSAPLASAVHASLNHPVGSSTAAEATMTTAAADTLLYQRVIRSDGSAQWVMVEEPSTTLALRSNPDTATASSLAISGSGLQRANYILSAKPAGLNKAVKSCGSNGKPSRASASDVYDILCNTMS